MHLKTCDDVEPYNTESSKDPFDEAIQKMLNKCDLDTPEGKEKFNNTLRFALKMKKLQREWTR
jgi:hypothetical protein